MMNANAILEKLSADAKAQAAAILTDANDRAAAMRRASDEKIAEARKAMLTRADEEAALSKQRMLRMHELDEHKKQLAAKRAMMDRAFEAALAKLQSMPKEQARAYLTDVVVSVADGDEQLVIGAERDAWFDADFVREANKALAASGKPDRLTVSSQRRSGMCGLALVKDMTEINCSFASLLASQRLALEAEVAKLLFPDD